jgi:hypothetical protein
MSDQSYDSFVEDSGFQASSASARNACVATGTISGTCCDLGGVCDLLSSGLESGHVRGTCLFRDRSLDDLPVCPAYDGNQRRNTRDLTEHVTLLL